jgi:hypothetical protein
LTDPAVPTSLAGDWALLTHDDPRRTALELAIVKAAKHHDANPLALGHPGPGIGTRLSLVRRSDLQDRGRFPRGPAVVSDGRRGKRATDSAGTRVGPAGHNLGHAHLKGAVAEAAAVCPRQHPAGPTRLARVGPTQGQGTARTLLAHRLARAV